MTNFPDEKNSWKGFVYARSFDLESVDLDKRYGQTFKYTEQ